MARYVEVICSALHRSATRQAAHAETRAEREATMAAGLWVHLQEKPPDAVSGCTWQQPVPPFHSEPGRDRALSPGCACQTPTQVSAAKIILLDMGTSGQVGFSAAVCSPVLMKKRFGPRRNNTKPNARPASLPPGFDSALLTCFNLH